MLTTALVQNIASSGITSILLDSLLQPPKSGHIYHELEKLLAGLHLTGALLDINESTQRKVSRWLIPSLTHSGELVCSGLLPARPCQQSHEALSTR